MSNEFSLGDVVVKHGRISYLNETPPQPETRKIDGNVTVINAAREGSPAYFAVNFIITAPFDFGGVPESNTLYWDVVVREPDISAEYRAVEDRAFRQIVPMLRSLADRIAADFPDTPDPSETAPVQD